MSASSGLDASIANICPRQTASLHVGDQNDGIQLAIPILNLPMTQCAALCAPHLALPSQLLFHVQEDSQHILGLTAKNGEYLKIIVALYRRE